MFKKHVFVCQNMRDSSKGKSCGKIGIPFREKLKKEIIRMKLNRDVRINKSGCLGKCSQGPCLVIYPDQKWYFNLELNQIDEIIDKVTSD